MSGFKQWLTGELVRAADFNSYVQNQVIAVFASAAERNAEVTAPVDGQHAYLTDADILTVYDGSAWKGPALPRGMGVFYGLKTTDSNGIATVTRADLGLPTTADLVGAVGSVVYQFTSAGPHMSSTRANATDVSVLCLHSAALWPSNQMPDTQLRVAVLAWNAEYGT